VTGEPQVGRRRSWRGPAVGGLLVGMVLAILCVGALSAQGTTVVRTIQQPTSVSYPDNSTHYVALKRYVSIGAPVVGGTHYELWLGRDPQLGYGHTVAVDITGTAPEQFETDWTEQGVRVRFASGHEIFVPARSFIGGR